MRRWSAASHSRSLGGEYSPLPLTCQPVGRFTLSFWDVIKPPSHCFNEQIFYVLRRHVSV